MQILASLQRSARSLLGITPTASLSPGEQPQVHLVTAPAAQETVAYKKPLLKRASLAELGLDPKAVMESYIDQAVERRMSGAPVSSAHRVSPPLRSGPARLVKPRAASITPNVDDDDIPVPTSKPDTTVSDVFKTIEDALKQLKKMLPAGDDTGDDDVDEAKAALSAGLKTKAFTCLNRGMEKVGARIQAVKFAALSPMAKMASSFNAQPAIAALSASLSPGRRASVALSPVGGAPAAVVRPTAITAIRAQIKANDDLQRREGFTNARQSEHLKLSALLDAELKKLRK